jgi:predicted metal-dependent HD superfamily phosphohydrolase
MAACETAYGPVVCVGVSPSGLRERFAGLWKRLGGRGDGEPAFEDLLRAWQEPHRRYHGLDHLRDCLARLDESPATGKGRDLAEAALWYHDVVYQPGATDSEARSAEKARAALLRGGVPEDVVAEVARAVRLTDHSVVPTDPLAALVCDVDLSILGRPAQEFAAYEQLIRDEYRLVPAPLYQAARARVLERLLARDPLFLTPHFRDRYEAPARLNLARSIQALTEPTT